MSLFALGRVLTMPRLLTTHSIPHQIVNFSASKAPLKFSLPSFLETKLGLGNFLKSIWKGADLEQPHVQHFRFNQNDYFSTSANSFHLNKDSVPINPLVTMVGTMLLVRVMTSFARVGQEKTTPEIGKSDGVGLTGASKPPSTPQPPDLGKLKEAVKKDFDQKVSEMRNALPEKDRVAFDAHAQKLWNGIDRLVFQPAEKRMKEDSTDVGTLYKAQKDAKNRLDDAFRHLAMFSEELTADQRPQLRSNDRGELVTITSAPPVTTIVAQGGGTKGVSTASALLELFNTGKFDEIERLVGTSAGALATTCLACGDSAHDFYEFSDSVPLLEIIKPAQNQQTLYPGIDFGWVGFSGGRVMELADQKSAVNVAAFLKAGLEDDAFKEKLAKLDEGQRARLEVLRNPSFDSDRTGKMITFRDLTLLNSLDPKKFKLLSLTGFDSSNKNPVYFDRDNTPDLPICFAARISMSIPLFFKSVTIDLGDGNGRRKMVDGGVASNVSTEVVTRGKTGKELEQVHATTVALTFSSGGRADNILHGPLPTSQSGSNGWLASLKNALIGVITTNPNYAITDRADQQKLYDKGPNTLVVHSGDLGMVSFWAPPDRVDRAKREGTEQMLRQLEQRTAQAMATTHGSVDEVIASLSEKDKNVIRSGAPPRREDFSGPRAEGDYQLNLELFKKLQDNQV